MKTNSFQCLVKSTQPGSPFFFWHPHCFVFYFKPHLYIPVSLNSCFPQAAHCLPPFTLAMDSPFLPSITLLFSSPPNWPLFCTLNLTSCDPFSPSPFSLSVLSSIARFAAKTNHPCFWDFGWCQDNCSARLGQQEPGFVGHAVWWLFPEIWPVALRVQTLGPSLDQLPDILAFFLKQWQPGNSEAWVRFRPAGHWWLRHGDTCEMLHLSKCPC